MPGPCGGHGQGVIGQALADVNMSEDPKFKRIAEATVPLSALLRTLSAAIQVAIPGLNNDLSDRATGLKTQLDKLQEKFLRKPEDFLPSFIYGAIADVKDDDGVTQGQLGAAMDSVATLEESLRKAALTTQASSLEPARKQIQEIYNRINKDMPAFEESPAGRAAKAKAATEVAVYRRIFDRVLKEVNVVGVSPLLLFDATRLSQNNLRPVTRPASGFGVKLSFFSLDLNVGYEWNRFPGAGKGGSFMFSFDIVDLFR